MYHVMCCSLEIQVFAGGQIHSVNTQHAHSQWFLITQHIARTKNKNISGNGFTFHSMDRDNSNKFPGQVGDDLIWDLPSSSTGQRSMK